MFERFLIFLFKKKLAGEGIVKFFINRGINPDFKDEEGKTILHRAVYCNNPEIVRLLLENGAQIDAKDNDGMTPLYWCFNFCHIDREIAELLISRGANIHIRDNNNTSLLHIVGNKHMAKILTSKGLDVNLKDNNGNRPIHFAENKSIAELLLSAGADVNVKNDDGETPLHSATDADYLYVIKFLISSGADINTVDNDGDTALHLSVMNESPEIVEFLISAGADLTIKNNEGKTPLEMAEQYRDETDEYDDILRLLTEKVSDKTNELQLPQDTNIHTEILPDNKFNIHINNGSSKNDFIKHLVGRGGFCFVFITVWSYFFCSFIISSIKKFEPINLLFIFIWIYLSIRFIFPWVLEILISFFGNVSIKIQKSAIILFIQWPGLFTREKVIPLEEINNIDIEYDIVKKDNKNLTFPYSVNIYHKMKKISVPVYLSEMETKWLYNKLMELL